jgi:type IX secretion system PorP/SprF family membrane protein
VLNNNQFTGFEQEPTTKVADVSFRLNDYKLGVSFINDIIGFDKSQNVKIRFARQFSISEKSSFSLGLSAGTIHKRLEATKMTFEFGDDPMSYYDIANTRFDFDFGCEFLVNNFFVGFSVNHLGKQFSNPDFDNPVSHYYAYAQMAINSTNTFRFYPNTLFRVWENTIYGELGILGFYKDKVWLGTSYSNQHDLVSTTGMRILKNILFGYSFKTNMNGKILNPGKANCHEIFLNFAFNNKNGYMKSVRFID